MGYRNYIGSISKLEHDKIKNFTKEELYEYKNEPLDEMGYIGPYDIVESIYELGKDVDVFPAEFFKPFFENQTLQNDFNNDHELFLVDKDFLKFVLDRYYDKVRSYYKSLLEPFQTDDKFPRLKDPKTYSPQDVYNVVKHIESISYEWGCSPFSDRPPYKIDDGEAITTSWKYEYAQFELVRIYKTFDWENNNMVYYGY